MVRLSQSQWVGYTDCLYRRQLYFSRDNLNEGSEGKPHRIILHVEMQPGGNFGI